MLLEPRCDRHGALVFPFASTDLTCDVVLTWQTQSLSCMQEEAEFLKTHASLLIRVQLQMEALRVTALASAPHAGRLEQLELRAQAAYTHCCDTLARLRVTHVALGRPGGLLHLTFALQELWQRLTSKRCAKKGEAALVNLNDLRLTYRAWIKLRIGESLALHQLESRLDGTILRWVDVIQLACDRFEAKLHYHIHECENSFWMNACRRWLAQWDQLQGGEPCAVTRLARFRHSGERLAGALADLLSMNRQAAPVVRQQLGDLRDRLLFADQQLTRLDSAVTPDEAREACEEWLLEDQEASGWARELRLGEDHPGVRHLARLGILRPFGCGLGDNLLTVKLELERLATVFDMNLTEVSRLIELTDERGLHSIARHLSENLHFINRLVDSLDIFVEAKYPPISQRLGVAAVENGYGSFDRLGLEALVEARELAQSREQVREAPLVRRLLTAIDEELEEQLGAAFWATHERQALLAQSFIRAAVETDLHVLHDFPADQGTTYEDAFEHNPFLSIFYSTERFLDSPAHSIKARQLLIKHALTLTRQLQQRWATFLASQPNLVDEFTQATLMLSSHAMNNGILPFKKVRAKCRELNVRLPALADEMQDEADRCTTALQLRTHSLAYAGRCLGETRFEPQYGEVAAASCRHLREQETQWLEAAWKSHGKMVGTRPPHAGPDGQLTELPPERLDLGQLDAALARLDTQTATLRLESELEDAIASDQPPEIRTALAARLSLVYFQLAHEKRTGAPLASLLEQWAGRLRELPSAASQSVASLLQPMRGLRLKLATLRELLRIWAFVLAWCDHRLATDQLEPLLRQLQQRLGQLETDLQKREAKWRENVTSFERILAAQGELASLLDFWTERRPAPDEAPERIELVQRHQSKQLSTSLDVAVNSCGSVYAALSDLDEEALARAPAEARRKQRLLAKRLIRLFDDQELTKARLSDNRWVAEFLRDQFSAVSVEEPRDSVEAQRVVQHCSRVASPLLRRQHSQLERGVFVDELSDSLVLLGQNGLRQRMFNFHDHPTKRLVLLRAVILAMHQRRQAIETAIQAAQQLRDQLARGCPDFSPLQAELKKLNEAVCLWRLNHEPVAQSLAGSTRLDEIERELAELESVLRELGFVALRVEQLSVEASDPFARVVELLPEPIGQAGEAREARAKVADFSEILGPAAGVLSVSEAAAAGLRQESTDGGVADLSSSLRSTDEELAAAAAATATNGLRVSESSESASQREETPIAPLIQPGAKKRLSGSMMEAPLIDSTTLQGQETDCSSRELSDDGFTVLSLSDAEHPPPPPPQQLQQPPPEEEERSFVTTSDDSSASPHIDRQPPPPPRPSQRRCRNQVTNPLTSQPGKTVAAAEEVAVMVEGPRFSWLFLLAAALTLLLVLLLAGVWLLPRRCGRMVWPSPIKYQRAGRPAF